MMQQMQQMQQIQQQQQYPLQQQQYQQQQQQYMYQQPQMAGWAGGQFVPAVATTAASEAGTESSVELNDRRYAQYVEANTNTENTEAAPAPAAAATPAAATAAAAEAAVNPQRQRYNASGPVSAAQARSLKPGNRESWNGGFRAPAAAATAGGQRHDRYVRIPAVHSLSNPQQAADPVHISGHDRPPRSKGGMAPGRYIYIRIPAVDPLSNPCRLNDPYTAPRSIRSEMLRRSNASNAASSIASGGPGGGKEAKVTGAAAKEAAAKEAARPRLSTVSFRR